MELPKTGNHFNQRNVENVNIKMYFVEHLGRPQVLSYELFSLIQSANKLNLS